MSEERLNFLEEIISKDLEEGKNDGRILTRFPPEPNGYLHIGHSKAIWINFNTAEKYGGKTNLRFDDTNPVTEETAYVEAIKRDIKWLGYEWEGNVKFASDYFDQLYEFAHLLIDKGLAFIDDATAEQIAEEKGTPTIPGRESKHRNRPIAENKQLFTEMKEGKHPDGAMVLRAKLDMASPNMHMRDPVLYRIKHAHHHRTGDQWCIYPMYDFTHGQSDSIEGVTHSMCSLEFTHHRPLYDWLIEQLNIFPSKQYEFARMNISYMVTSKRKLLRLINEGLVDGWDDPRMSTISAVRRKGYPPKAILKLCEQTGVTKRDNLIDIELLEFYVREELNKTASRVMAVVDPIKLVIINYPEGQTEELSLVNNPEDESKGSRLVPFGRELYIERSDFREDPPPPKKFYRLGPDRNVRLKGAYIIKGESFVKNDQGEIVEIHASYYPDSRSGSDTSGVKAKGVLHWVEVQNAGNATVHDYERLYTDPAPDSHDDKDFIDFYNPDSLKVNDKVKIEPSLLNATAGDTFQFMRLGYYCVDIDSTDEKLIFNRTVSLKDSWKKK